MKRLMAGTAASAVIAGLGTAYFYRAGDVPARPAENPAPVASNQAKPIAAIAQPPARNARMPSLRLVGVFVQQHGSTALLEVDGQSARPFREGDTLAPSWTLAQVTPEFVTVKDTQNTVRVGLQGGSAGAEHAVKAPAATAASDRIDSPPLVPVEVARERNRAFLEAVRARKVGS